jgi:hypothetical protein
MNTKTLRAVVDCLIPADDFPGAYEAGVCEYLIRLFESDLRDEAGFFSTGLNSIEEEANARFGGSFQTLTSDQQISTLEAIQHGDVVTDWPVPPRRFFDMLVCTTAEGFYSDPEQGGNRDAVSWLMTGFEESNS